MHKDGTTEIIPYDNGKMVSDNTIDSAQITPDIIESPQPIPSVGGTADIPYAFITANYPLYLYSNDGKTFLGKLTTDKYDMKSISYEYGDYGSKYSSESAFNEYASMPPIIVDSDGDFIAYLTANKYKTPGVTYVKLMRILKKYRQ